MKSLFLQNQFVISLRSTSSQIVRGWVIDLDVLHSEKFSHHVGTFHCPILYNIITYHTLIFCFNFRRLHKLWQRLRSRFRARNSPRPIPPCSLEPPTPPCSRSQMVDQDESRQLWPALSRYAQCFCDIQSEHSSNNLRQVLIVAQWCNVKYYIFIKIYFTMNTFFYHSFMMDNVMLMLV